MKNSFGIVIIVLLLFATISIFASFVYCSELRSDFEFNRGYQKGLVEGQGRLNDTNFDFWLNIIDEGTENFRIMRDLFTPAYNDSVTVENAGYKSTVYDWNNNSIISDGGWMFWVNHTRVLDSLYFDDRICYKVLFSTQGCIEVLR